jgi:hypothetical protein
VTPRERIARLEGLLGRIARNVAKPRAARAAVMTPVAATSATELAPPDSTPVVTGIPPVEPAAIGRASDRPPPSSVPTARPAAPAPELGSTVSVEAAAEPAPAPATLDLASPGVSSVPPWKPEPSSSVQAPLSSLPPEELSDDDLVEVTTIPPAPAAEPASLSAQESEEPPASSRRSKVAETLDQALASAAVQPDEIEVPIHTPPPESGPQEAVLPAGMEAPRAPEFADLDAEIVRPVSLGPTTEQLGETIELEASEGPELEIDVAGVAAPEPEPERPLEELEVSLPRAEMQSGTYDVSVSAPGAEDVAAPAVSAAPSNDEPEVSARPVLESTDVARMVRAADKAPEAFVELLDRSLGL